MPEPVSRELLDKLLLALIDFDLTTAKEVLLAINSPCLTAGIDQMVDQAMEQPAKPTFEPKQDTLARKWAKR